MTAFLFNDNQTNTISKRYVGGETTSQIAIDFGVDRKTIYNYLKRMGVPIKRAYVNSATKELIISNYESGVRNGKLSKDLNVHRATIQRVLKSSGVELRSLEETSRKHEINDKFFDIIDTPEKAYFFGLIFADGSIYGTDLSISLVYTDFEPLYRLSKILYGKCLLKFTPQKEGYYFSKNVKSACNGQWRLNVGSKKLVSGLKSNGLVERKSFTKRYPDIPKYLDKHFIRGYFDGNGHISKAKIKGNSSAGFTSATAFCEDLKVKIESHLGIYVGISPKIPGISSLRISGMSQLRKFLDWIYEDSEIHILRKYEKYKELFNL